MKNILESVIFGFKELLNWHTLKYVLATGTAVTLMWLAIGFAIWDFLLAISSKIINLIPFAMVQTNGAWMLSSFIWLQFVLITYALILAFFGNMVLRTMPKEKYPAFTILVLIASAIFWTIVWHYQGDYIYNEILKLIQILPYETIQKGLAFLVGFYIIYNGIIVTMLFVTSIFSEVILSYISKKYFPNEPIYKNNVFKSIGYTIRDTIIFTIATIVAFPLLFIPVVNIVTQVILWTWLVKDTISYDAASLTFEKVDKSELKKHRFALWFISLITAFFNFVPILNLFGPYFGEISMFHYFKTLKKEK